MTVPSARPDIRALVDTLLTSGLLTSAEVFSDSFAVEHRTGRNALTLVKTSEQTLVLKQFTSHVSSARELASLMAAHRATLSGAFAIPALIEATRYTLLTRTRPGLESIGSRRDARHGAGPRVTRSVAKRVASALASLHTVPVPATAIPAPPSVGLGGVGPWILDVPQPARDLIAVMQQPPVRDALLSLDEDLRAEPAVFVHGDIRTGNVLADVTGGLWIIDWETAGTGSATLDLAALIATVIELAVTAGHGPPHHRVITSALDTYVRATGSQVDIPLTTRATGARLLQSAVERALHEHEASPRTRSMFTLGRYLVAKPLEGATRIGVLG